eukprot:scaffold200860_cov15-Tisochrysis_lutea.AAC.1
MAFPDVCYPDRHVCQLDLGSSLSLTRPGDGQLHSKVAIELSENLFGSQIIKSFMECAMQMWDSAYPV